MEAIIDSLKKAGKIFYPKTKTKAVYDDNNNRLDNTLTSINDSLNNRPTINKNVNLASQTVTDSSVVTFAQFTLTTGKYIINFGAEMTLQANGIGGISLSESNSFANGRGFYVSCACGANVKAMSAIGARYIDITTANTTFYLVGKALKYDVTFYPYYQIIKLD